MGFYVPDSLGQSYVANKKNDQGEYKYESMTDEALIQRQSAMQELNKQYSQTIDNAYASYLAANNNLNAAAMGQGYKELYKQMQQNELTSNIDQISAQAAEARAQIDANTTEQLAAIQKAQSTEVSNFDRLARDFDSYLGYVRNLTKTDGENTTSWLSDTTGYTEDEVKDLTVDQLYDILSQTGQDAYKDAQGNVGLSFLQWHRDQLKDTASDNAYRQWVYDYNDSGKTGYQEFLDAPKSTKQINREEVLEVKAKEHQEMLDKAIEMYEPLVMAQLRGANGKELMNEQIKFNRETKQDLENLMSKYNISGEELYKAIVEKNKGEIEQYTAQKEKEAGVTEKFESTRIDDNTWKINNNTYKSNGFITKNDYKWKNINKKLDLSKYSQNTVLKFGEDLYVVGPYQSLIKLRRI